MKHLFLAFLTTIVALSSLNAQSSEEWLELENENYTLSYPADWELQSPGQMGTEFMIFSPQTSNEDLFKENANVVIQDIAAFNLDLDAYINLTTEQIPAMIPNSKIILSERKEKDGVEFHKMLYTGTQNQYELTFEQFIFIVEGNAYVLTFTTEQTTYETYQATGEKILSSFKFK